MNLRTVLICGVLMTLTGLATAEPIIIDDFNGGTVSLTVNETTTTDSDTVSYAGALGGSRYSGLEWEAGSTTDITFKTENPGANGIISYASEPSHNGKFMLAYDGDGSMDENLTVTGDTAEDAFKITFTFADLTSDAYIEAWSGSSNSSIFYGQTPNQGQAVQSVLAFFDEFSVNSGSGVDWTSVTKIEYGVDSDIGADYSIDQIEVVPEPSIMAVLSIGAGCLLARRRRRQKVA